MADILERFLAVEGGVKHLLWPIIPARDISVIGASAKCGKTVFALNLAYALAGGLPFLGWSTKPCRVLYIDKEMGEWSMRERLRSIHRELQSYDASQNLVVETRSRRPLSLDPNSTGLLRLRELVEKVQPALVILDPLRDCYSGDENDSGTLTEVFKSVFNLIDTFNTTVLLIHHTGKPEKMPGVGYGTASPLALRGSSRIFDVGASYIMLESPGAYHVRASFTLRHVGVQYPRVGQWEKDRWALRLKGEASND